MLTLPPGLVVFVATHVVDGRKGIDGLSNEVRNALGEDPLSGSMYVFFSKRRDRVRVLYYDRDGYVLVTKRLEVGRFAWPLNDAPGAGRRVEAAELLLVLEGIDLRGAQRRRRWRDSRA